MWVRSGDDLEKFRCGRESEIGKVKVMRMAIGFGGRRGLGWDLGISVCGC